MAQERLQKIIAKAGIASRRRAEDMIREGHVTVNGRVVTELGTRADAALDHVKVDGKLITKAEKHRYILIYKPRQVMTTVNDPQGRPTVVDIVKGVKERVFPVGRLDFQSEGLLLLTNDGELAFQVSHPKHGSVKTYHVKVRGVPSERIIEKLSRGITLDGKRTAPCEITRLRTTGRGEEEGNSWFDVQLREGRTQQIRKMFSAVGHPVVKLRRVAIGQVRDSKLEAGQWRDLTPNEVRLLSATESAPKPKPRAPRKPRVTRAVSKKAPATKRTTSSATKRPAARRASSATPARKPSSRETRRS
ncbi:MAG: pseudouridine synthase [Thermoanaerobaculia bacterium]|nr:pseudouridine synthase [Thermoanaerobaculia bacterium]